MTDLPPRPGDNLAPETTPLTPAERTRLAAADAQRRLQLLRIILPGLLAVTLLALPFGIQADIESHGIDSTLQDGIGVVAFAVGFWAMRRRRVDLASFSLFAGVTGVIVYLLLSDGPIHGPLDVTAIPAFALFILPIAIAGIFGGPRQTALATAATSAFTLLMILFTPHTPRLSAALQAPDGLAMFTIPLSTQIAFGILMFAATRGFHRTQRELVDVRVAYEREKELDRLKDRFIANVNHELRTPIMALQGYIALAQELGKRGDRDRQAQLLTRGAQAAENLASLVRSVLDVRRTEIDTAAIAPTTFALRPVILSATTLIDPRAAGEQTRPLHLGVPADLRVYADQDLVRQVTLNLLSNAVKYSPPGSSIEITARVRDDGAALWRMPRAAADTLPMVEIAVRDHGAGIPPDQAPLLFQRFVRLERDIASPIVGTGLGLAICRSYVESMGGRIWVESAGVPGEGSIFFFTLPAARPDPAAAPPASEPAADEPAPGPTLAPDDDIAPPTSVQQTLPA
jgi:signal transduction histidine kinase